MLSLVLLLSSNGRAQSVFFIEAEDFDYGRGQHPPETDAMPYYGAAYFNYFDTVAERGIDFYRSDFLHFIEDYRYGEFPNVPILGVPMNKASLSDKFALIHEHWRPKVVAGLNAQELKLVKFAGTFPWHHHEQEDELFLVWRGQMAIEFRDRLVTLHEGEFCVVPRGVEHRTMAEAEAEVLLFEPAHTRNTGNIVDETFTAPNRVEI